MVTGEQNLYMVMDEHDAPYSEEEYNIFDNESGLTDICEYIKQKGLELIPNTRLAHEYNKLMQE